MPQETMVSPTGHSHGKAVQMLTKGQVVHYIFDHAWASLGVD